MSARNNRVNKNANKLLFESIIDNYTLRRPQIRFEEWVEKPLDAGKKFIILEAPPGVGKSLISQLYIKKYREMLNVNAKFDLLTCTKNLQQQYLDTFPYLYNLWGKSNYKCEKYDNNCEYGKTCNSNKGSEPCENCPHTKAHTRWLEGDISMTNFHIHGLYSMFNKELMEKRDSEVLIVDECHTLEPTVHSFVSFKLSKNVWSKFINEMVSVTWENDVFNYNTIHELSEWIKNTLIPQFAESRKDLDRKSNRLSGKKLTDNIKIIQELDGLTNTITKFLGDYKSNTSEWVIDKRQEKGIMLWDIQPLWTGEIMKENIWKGYKNVLLMSGTIIDPHMFCEVNGIPIDDVAFLKLGSPFPKANRPIYYIPKGRMSYKNKVDTWKVYKDSIKKLLDKYKGKKGIIHCGNYELWEWLKKDVKDSRLIFASPEDRQKSIDKHINATNDSVIVSPSMKQGVDLKDDLSRFQIILKMPYPSLASKVNKRRSEKNKNWYSWMTVMDVIQSYGRSIRSDVDYADTIILDSCFSDIMTQHGSMLPSYFTEAIKKINTNTNKKRTR